MKDDNLIDYSLPLIDASKAIKNANDALLKQDYDGAMESLLDLAVCARTAYVSVRFQKEQQNALRKQTAPV
jgi:hypothetical protein